MTRPLQLVILSVALGAALFHLYAAGVSPFTALVQRPIHLALMAVLGFLGLEAGRSPTGSGTAAPARSLAPYAAGVLIAGTLFSSVYLVLQHQALVRRAGDASALDLLAGGIAIAVVLELARRSTGWGLVSIASLALAYALVGPYLPGFLAHRGYSPARVIEHLYLGTEGIWGVPLGVSADFVYLFVLFGAVLDAAGGGQLLIGLASRVAGRTPGGPAKTAAVASALMGSLSGSAVANVVTTGSLTIPAMKRMGFRPHFAAAIEAAASTGGQLMPPIMGAGAFILATWTNIPYIRVATAAALPALLYYAALFMAIHFRAQQVGLCRSDTRSDAPLLAQVHLLAPLAIIVALLAAGRSPMRAAFWGVVAAAVATLLRAATRLDAKRARRTLIAAAAGTVQVAAACAAAGIVVGIASLTGIGLRMSQLIVTLSGGVLPIALVLTAVGAIVLGMGLPTTAAYIVLAALGAPALTELGVPLLGAHLFIFYFGCLSNVTPPVALAAYAASGIAGSAPIKTAFTAMGLAAAGFLVPFMFIYGPALLLEASPAAILLATVSAVIGVTALAGAIIGHLKRPLIVAERVLLAIAAAVLIFPGVISDLVGIIVVAVMLLRRAPGGPTGIDMRHRILILTLLAAGFACGAGEGAGERRFLSIGTAGTGGIYYPLGGAIANRLSAIDPRRRYTAEVTGGSVENLNRIAKGEMDFGFSIGTSLYEAYHGGDSFRQPLSRLRVLAPLYPNVTHILIGRGVRISTLAELRGREVSLGAPGSGTEQVARQLLEAYGLRRDDIHARYLSFRESSDALRDGAIDAAILSVGYPASAVLEATTSGGVRLLAVDTEHRDALARRYPYYADAVIPKGAYPGVAADVATVSVMNWVVGRDDLDDAVVRDLLETLRDERDRLIRVHDIARQIDLRALDRAPILLHPETQRWWERSRGG